MNVRLELFLHTFKHKRLVVTSILVFVIIQFILSVQLVASTLNYDRIYKGVYINDIDVSGMTQDQAKELVKETYEPRFKKMKIVIKGGGEELRVSAESVLSSMNIEDTVQEAFDQGRKGGFLARLAGIVRNSVKGKNLDLEYEFDDARLQQIVGKFLPKVKKDMVQTTYQVYEDRIVIYLGRSGEDIDEGRLRRELMERIETAIPEELELPIMISNPDPIDLDKLHKEIFTEAKDATFAVNGYNGDIIPHVIGRDFDVESAKDLLKNKEEGSIVQIPLKLTYPEVYEQELKDAIFKDTLSSFSTRYNQGYRDRSENIRVAASKINGIVLGLGQVFSYNEVVGERTIARGFKEAHVYSGGRVVDGVGGGICQVSTTLYNAVLYADLEVVERKNHNMLVSYVPPGLDATVAYGSIDFKFKNSTSNPIKIITSAGSGTLKIEIKGTNPNPSRKVELKSEVLSSYYLKEKVIEDPTQPVGYSKVVQSGMKGCKANTYKIIKENGKEISRKLISTNRYNAMQRIVKKGTKPKTVPAQQTSTIQQ